MDKHAYNNYTSIEPPYSEIPEKEWKGLAKRVELSFLHSKRAQGQKSSIDSEIDKLASDWSLTERERFRRWFKHNHTTASLGGRMQKTADLYSPMGSSEVKQKFDATRKSLTRRIRKLQNELSEMYNQTHKSIQWADAPGVGSFQTGDAKISAILNALNHVCTLLSTLRTKEVTAAVLIRTANILEKLDPTVAQQYRKAVGSRSSMLRIARSAEVAALAQELKREMDIFHYGTHLRRLYSIYDKLSKLGLTSPMIELEKLIQKDLPDITGLYEKLSDIYVELVELPDQQDTSDPAAGITPQAGPTPQTKSQFDTLETPRKENLPAANPAANPNV